MEWYGFLLILFFVLFAYETSNKLKRIHDSIQVLHKDMRHDAKDKTTKKEIQ